LGQERKKEEKIIGRNKKRKGKSFVLKNLKFGSKVFKNSNQGLEFETNFKSFQK
jgi:hypothetical protein